MPSLEIEVKFYLHEPAAAREQLAALGGVFKDRLTETNVCFEDTDHSLIAKNALLRLRQTDHASVLTYKGEPPETHPEFKTYREWEVSVSDFETTEKILGALGYFPAQRYEKIRETCTIDDTTVCVDEMPYGHFVEIEGQPESIRDVAEKMGLNWHDRILDNYLAIFDRLKTELNLDFSDVTFDNFKAVEMDFRDFNGLFTANT